MLDYQLYPLDIFSMWAQKHIVKISQNIENIIMFCCIPKGIKGEYQKITKSEIKKKGYKDCLYVWYCQVMKKPPLKPPKRREIEPYPDHNPDSEPETEPESEPHSYPEPEPNPVMSLSQNQNQRRQT